VQNDIKKLRRQLLREGWSIERGGNHYKAYHPKGGFVVISVSPSCHHALRNIKGDINRLKQQHNEEKMT
jgi:predicted RNA binding protein YcfA (HicA-like mRNA interferase family)